MWTPNSTDFRACPAPVTVKTPPHVVVSWETNDALYKLKAYFLDGRDRVDVLMDASSLGAAQMLFEDIILGD